MNKKQVMDQLAAVGTAQNRKIYERHGVRGASFGVSYANLGKLARAIDADQRLAEELWQTGNHDARVLATMIADPAAITLPRLEAWFESVDNYVLCDALAKVAARTPLAEECMRRWTASPDEWRSAAGWTVLGAIGDRVNDIELEKALREIEASIHGAKNRTRHAMNNALIGIGMRSAALRAKAIAVARRIGVVEVDHGETGCKTPDAESYILKAVAYRAATGAKKKGAAAGAAAKKTTAKKVAPRPVSAKGAARAKTAASGPSAKGAKGARAQSNE